MGKHKHTPKEDDKKGSIAQETRKEMLQMLSHVLNNPDGLTKENLAPVVSLLLSNPKALENILNSPLFKLALNSGILSQFGNLQNTSDLNKDEVLNILKTFAENEIDKEK